MLCSLYPRGKANAHVRLTAGEKRRLLPLYQLDLEQAIECINDNECLEVTLQHLHVAEDSVVVNMRPKRRSQPW